MPPPRFSRSRLNGEVVVRRLQPPQLETIVAISKGELVEPLDVVSLRIGLSCTASTQGEESDLFLADEGGFAVAMKLVDKGVYYMTGGTVIDMERRTLESPADTRKVYLSAIPNNPSPQLPDAAVLWAFDTRMLLHRPVANRSPETPFRLQRAVQALQRCARAADVLPLELLTSFTANMDGSMQVDPEGAAVPKTSANTAKWVVPRAATAEEVYSFQDPQVYRSFIESGTTLSGLKSDVYCNVDTSSAAVRLSVGAVIDASVEVLRTVGHIRRGEGDINPSADPLIGYCLVRPPGHHCTASQPSGFCLVNNVAIAAEQLRRHHASLLPNGKPRVAILDLDVHFGEGTASYVESAASPSTLLYMSLHRYDEGKYYPFDSKGKSSYTGVEGNVQGRGGCICNVAVNTNAHRPQLCEQVISDHVMTETLEKIFLPRLELFQPDMVLVSLGFDASYGDPLGRMAVEGGFASVLSRLKQWCHRENHATGLVVVLEGGYNPESVAQGVVSVGLALSLPCTDPAVQAATQEHLPRVWADLRHRQERLLQEWQAIQRERADGGTSTTAATRVSDNAAGDVHSDKPEPLPEDAALLARHKVWCASMIEKVRQLHRSGATCST